MASKFYTNPNMVIDASSDFGPDEIMDYIGQFEKMRTAKSADARAERMAVLQEAQMKYNTDLAQKTEKATNYLKKHTSSGFDYDNLFAEGDSYLATFGKSLPNPGVKYKEYEADMASIGQSADRTMFMQNWNQDAITYVNAQAGKFNAHKDALKATLSKQGPVTEKQLNAIMKNYGGNELYTNMRTLYASAGLPFQTGPGSPLNYEPGIAEDERGFFEKAGDWWSGGPTVQYGGQEYSPEGGNKTMPALTVGGGILGERYLHGKQLTTASEGIMEQAIKDYGKPKAGGIEWDDFEKKYGVKKKFFDPEKGFQKLNSKGKDIVETMAKKKTTRGKVFAYGSEKAKGLVDKASKLSSNKTVTRGRGYLPARIGAEIGTRIGESAGPIGEIVGGIGGGVAGHITMKKLATKLSDPAVLKKLYKVAGGNKRLAKIMSKLGISAAGIAVPEPVSSAVGVVGAAWAAHDLYQLAQAVPEIYDILAGE